jgi:hypothetical protein
MWNIWHKYVCVCAFCSAVIGATEKKTWRHEMNIEKTIARLREQAEYEREVGYFPSRSYRLDYLATQLECMTDDYLGRGIVFGEVVA